MSAALSHVLAALALIVLVTIAGALLAAIIADAMRWPK